MAWNSVHSLAEIMAISCSTPYNPVLSEFAYLVLIKRFYMLLTNGVSH